MVLIRVRRMTKSDDGWHIVIPINPVATPRPSFRRAKQGTITFYSDKYNEYLESISEYLKAHKSIDNKFFREVNAPLGAVASIDFFIQAPISQKRINIITRTTAPDIDNLVKGVLDGIFRDLKVRDSRIVGLSTMKYTTLDNPRIEVTIRGITARI